MRQSPVIVMSVLCSIVLGCAMKDDSSREDSQATGSVSTLRVKVVVISWKQEEGKTSYFLNGENMGLGENGFEHIVKLLEKEVGAGSVYPIMNPQFALPMDSSANVVVFPFATYSSSYPRFLKMTHGSWALDEGPMDQVLKARARML